MNQTAAEPVNRKCVDVTGLTDDAIRAVESLVAVLRAQAINPRHQFSSHEDWEKAFNEWVDSHPKRDVLVDDSREGIYAGRGE